MLLRFYLLLISLFLTATVNAEALIIPAKEGAKNSPLLITCEGDDSYIIDGLKGFLSFYEVASATYRIKEYGYVEISIEKQSSLSEGGLIIPDSTKTPTFTIFPSAPCTIAEIN